MKRQILTTLSVLATLVAVAPSSSFAIMPSKSPGSTSVRQYGRAGAAVTDMWTYLSRHKLLNINSYPVTPNASDCVIHQVTLQNVGCIAHQQQSHSGIYDPYNASCQFVIPAAYSSTGQDQRVSVEGADAYPFAQNLTDTNYDIEDNSMVSHTAKEMTSHIFCMGDKNTDTLVVLY